MTTVHATLEIGPFLVRADEAARTAYLFSLAGNPDLRRCDFGSGEVMEILIGYADGDMTFEEAVEAFGETVPTTPFDLVAHLVRQREFSLKTFGPGPRLKGVIDHIRKELVEIEADPTDLKEWVDLILLAFDGAWRAGHSPTQIVAGINAKQSKNEGRDWPDWRTADPDKAIEHVRAGE